MPDRSALLPTETNDESPTPSRPAASMIAIPRPPLWDMKPTRPAVAGCGANVALSRTSGAVLSTPRQLGPTSRIPASRQTSTQLALAARALLAGLGEAGRDHEQRAHAGGRALARDRDDLAGRHDDHRQLDARRDVGDRAVGRQRLHDVGAAR